MMQQKDGSDSLRNDGESAIPLAAARPTTSSVMEANGVLSSDSEEAVMIDKICEGLFISDAASVISERGKTQMTELGITFVLTTSGMPIPDFAKMPTVQYKFIFMMDMLTQDMLGNNLLEDALAFIEEGVKSGGKVLVHCEVGISRSVAVVAAYLMKLHEWNTSKAILFIQNSRPIACPNSSFVRQLSIFKSLGYKADTESLERSSHYRHFCADTGNIPHTGTVFGNTSTSMDQLNNKTGKVDVQPSSTESQHVAHKRYRCRRCRSDLFYDTHIMRHSKGDNANDIHLENLEAADLCTYDYLITPMKWMTVDEYQGKICCPKCGEKLGQYIWGGRQCIGEDGQYCGRHVTPWVHIQKAKCDESPLSPLAAKLSGIRAHVPLVSSQSTDKNERIAI